MPPVVIGAVVGGAISAVGSIVAANKQEAAQEQALAQQQKAERAKQNIARAQARRSRLQQIREQRIRAGQIQQRAAVGGVGGASSAFGALGSLQSQLEANLSFIDQQQALGQQASQALMSAQETLVQGQAEAAMIGGLFGAAGNIAGSAIGSGLFSSTPAPQVPAST